MASEEEIIENVLRDRLAEIEEDMNSYAHIVGTIQNIYGPLPTTVRHELALVVVERMLERNINIGFLGGKPGELLRIDPWPGTVRERVERLRALIPTFSDPPYPDETPWLERTWNLKTDPSKQPQPPA
jgi:hypothetical protein